MTNKSRQQSTSASLGRSPDDQHQRRKMHRPIKKDREGKGMCKLLNKSCDHISTTAKYIGRGSKWGNPFVIGRDGDRAAVIAKYERWLANQHHLLRALDELRGFDLVCFCAPLACHGDILLMLANASRAERIAWWRRITAQK